MNCPSAKPIRFPVSFRAFIVFIFRHFLRRGRASISGDKSGQTWIIIRGNWIDSLLTALFLVRVAENDATVVRSQWLSSCTTREYYQMWVFDSSIVCNSLHGFYLNYLLYHDLTHSFVSCDLIYVAYTLHEATFSFQGGRDSSASVDHCFIQKSVGHAAADMYCVRSSLVSHDGKQIPGAIGTFSKHSLSPLR